MPVLRNKRARRLAPERYNANQLETILVGDAMSGIATELSWAVDAYARMAKLRGISLDEAFLSVRNAVEVQGRIMPGVLG